MGDDSSGTNPEHPGYTIPVGAHPVVDSREGNGKTVAPTAAAPIGNILGAPAVGAIKAEGKESRASKVGDQGIGAA